MSFELEPRSAHQMDVADDEDLTDIEEGDDYKMCDCTQTRKPSGFIQYKSIYDPFNDVPSSEWQYFVPGLPVKATVVSAVRDTDHVINVFSQYFYKIMVEHDGQQWYVDRKYADFQRLHNRLIMFRATQKLTAPFSRLTAEEVPAPSEPKTRTTLRLQRDEGLTQAGEVDTMQHPALTKQFFGEIEPPEEPPRVQQQRRLIGRAHRFPRLVFRPGAWIGAENVHQRREELQTYLTAILHLPAIRQHRETAAFFEVSRLSFVHNLEHKQKEGLVIKKPGGHLDFKNCKRLYTEKCGKWNQRWFFLKDTFLGYMHPGTDLVREVMLFDSAFQADAGSFQSQGVAHGVLISNKNRQLLMQFKSKREADGWKNEIDQAINAPVSSDWRKVHQFSSTFPLRRDSYAQWFVDGQSYLEHVAHVMECAREEIFIGGWFITAELFMKRPVKGANDPWQLANILKRKAEDGVHVFVLFYKEFEKVNDNGSAWARRILASLHPRIVVARHPDQPCLWAHHEKIVVVDQNIAFAGGIDLSYGRWDDHNHWLTDLPGEHVKSGPSINESAVCPMPQVVTTPDLVTNITVGLNGDHQTRDTRGLWHEPVTKNGVGESDAVVATDERDLTSEDIVDFIEGDKREKIRNRLDTPPKHLRQRLKKSFEEWRHKTPTNDPKRWYGQYERIIAKIDQIKEASLEHGKDQLWIGKDYTNWFKDYVVGYELPYHDQFDRRLTNRTPWHDCACVVYGAAARDLARHFIQRWNACKEEKFEDRDAMPVLMPKSYLHTHVSDVFCSLSHPCRAQILRSGYRWSIGATVLEDSIHQAYCHMISNAKRYIYIENQFFVSRLNDSYIKNQVCQAIHDRILRAHRAQEDFRVYIFLPLVVCFAGEIGESMSLNTMLYFAYTSICRGPNSLLANLEIEIGDCSKYVRFYALRTFADLCGRLISDSVYIHTKAMIVDDEKAIIGSANINDRSMLGDRDSEVAIYVEDTQFEQDNPTAGKFCASFRRQLMAEHTGLLDHRGHPLLDEPRLRSPSSQLTWDFLASSAKNNTFIFDQVFKCFPSDQVMTWDDLARYRREAVSTALCVLNRQESESLLNQLQGRIVDFPLKFLQNASLEAMGGLLPQPLQYPFT